MTSIFGPAIGSGSGNGGGASPGVNPFHRPPNYTKNLFDIAHLGNVTVTENADHVDYSFPADGILIYALTQPFQHCVFKMKSTGTSGNHQDAGLAFRQNGATRYFSVGVGTGASGNTDYHSRVLSWGATTNNFIEQITHASIAFNERWYSVKIIGSQVAVSSSVDGIAWDFLKRFAMSSIGGMTGIDHIGMRGGAGDRCEVSFYSDDTNPYTE